MMGRRGDGEREWGAAGWQEKEESRMNATLKGFLERAEFEAIDAAVRYYAGSASAEELAAMTERFRELRDLAADLEHRNNGLFEFSPEAEASTVEMGH